MRILCTGNPSEPGIAKSLVGKIQQIDFISRANGYDLTTEEGQNKFSTIIPDYDIFINHSQLIPNGQRRLLEICKKKWKKGLVINIGSVLEFKKWSWIDPESAAEKNRLRELSLNYNSENFRTCHIIIGGIKTNKTDSFRLDPCNVANTILYVINQKFHIPLIYIDETYDQLIDQWENYRPSEYKDYKDSWLI